MLDYAPDGMAAGGSAFVGREWSISWQLGQLPGENLLCSMIAASRATVIRTNTSGSRPELRTQPAFHPERVSGFCAAG